MPNLLLQLVHVSDSHVAPSRKSQSTRLMIDRLPLGREIKAYLKQGCAGHDPAAFRELEMALASLFAVEPASRAVTTLVMTGDLSTFGDFASVHAARTQFQRMCTRQAIRPVIIYGNHDVWPGNRALPLLASRGTLDSHRTELRTRFFPDTWPLGPLLQVDLGFNRILGVFSLNTVVHDRIDNTFAMGFVREDRYWENGTDISDQRLELPRRASRSDVALVLTHHPVHEPSAPVRQTIATLVNGVDVARVLSGTSPDNASPLVRVVISGHMHQVFPAHGALPQELPLSGAGHVPLEHHHVQLIVGTISQWPWNGNDQEHIFQLLRFWSQDTGELFLERIIYTRNNGAGPFRPLGAAGAVAERLKLL